MWEKRRPEPPSGRPVHHTHEHQSAATPMPQPQPITTAPTQFRPAEPAQQKGTAIGAAVSIVGDIYSEEDLVVEGEVKGRLELKNSRLTIGPKGKANSNIRAREVIIQGKVQGDVEASHKITIKKDGSLVGNIKTTGIIIDDDAYFKGSIDIVRKEAEAIAS